MVVETKWPGIYPLPSLIDPPQGDVEAERQPLVTVEKGLSRAVPRACLHLQVFS